MFIAVSGFLHRYITMHSNMRLGDVMAERIRGYALRSIDAINGIKTIQLQMGK